MNLDFSSEQDMLRKSVAEFLAKECPFDDVRELEDSEDGYSSKIWKKMAKLGWMELYFPEAFGGLGDPFTVTIFRVPHVGSLILTQRQVAAPVVGVDRIADSDAEAVLAAAEDDA